MIIWVFDFWPTSYVHPCRLSVYQPNSLLMFSVTFSASPLRFSDFCDFHGSLFLLINCRVKSAKDSGYHLLPPVRLVTNLVVLENPPEYTNACMHAYTRVFRKTNRSHVKHIFLSVHMQKHKIDLIFPLHSMIFITTDRVQTQARTRLHQYT